jgi:hypothetical protein
MKQHTMKLAILSMSAIAVILAIGFTPAQATVMAPSLKAYKGSSMTPVHCKTYLHCHWLKKGVYKREKHCHVCSAFR